jgi:hypothetical protein
MSELFFVFFRVGGRRSSVNIKEEPIEAATEDINMEHRPIPDKRKEPKSEGASAKLLKTGERSTGSHSEETKARNAPQGRQATKTFARKMGKDKVPATTGEVPVLLVPDKVDTAAPDLFADIFQAEGSRSQLAALDTILDRARAPQLSQQAQKKNKGENGGDLFADIFEAEGSSQLAALDTILDRARAPQPSQQQAQKKNEGENGGDLFADIFEAEGSSSQLAALDTILDRARAPQPSQQQVENSESGDEVGIMSDSEDEEEEEEGVIVAAANFNTRQGSMLLFSLKQPPPPPPHPLLCELSIFQRSDVKVIPP